MAVEVADVRYDTSIDGWVDTETDRMCLAIGSTSGQVLLGLTEDGAHHLVETIKRELKVLCPSGYACDSCLDTGTHWVPVARGAVARTRCDCQLPLTAQR